MKKTRRMTTVKTKIMMRKKMKMIWTPRGRLVQDGLYTEEEDEDEEEEQEEEDEN